jgi:hypothetical protein
MPPRPRRLPWADLLKRVFGDDVLQCPCGGRRKMVAFIPGPQMAQEILAALKIQSARLWIAKARAPPHQESFDVPVDSPRFAANTRTLLQMQSASPALEKCPRNW